MSAPGQAEPARRFDPAEWERLGFSQADARLWWKYRIVPRDALEWRRVNITEPVGAIVWQVAGIRPSEVQQWLDAGIDAREAAAWKEHEFDAASALRHKRAGRGIAAARQYRDPGPANTARQRPVTIFGGTHRGPGGGGPQRLIEALRGPNPRLIHSYLQRQWFDDEAIAWAKHGIQAVDALAWKEIGLTPAEAEAQQAQGLTPVQTMRLWWHAGIPFDELAVWIGAGLTPEEAAEQRANGITVERAAILRSLRKQK